VSIQPELWVEQAAAALTSYRDAFGARVVHCVDDPDSVVKSAVDAGAVATSPVGDEHGWRLGRVVDSFGHEWEVGKPMAGWPPP